MRCRVIVLSDKCYDLRMTDILYLYIKYVQRTRIIMYFDCTHKCQKHELTQTCGNNDVHHVTKYPLTITKYVIIISSFFLRVSLQHEDDGLVIRNLLSNYARWEISPLHNYGHQKVATILSILYERYGNNLMPLLQYMIM